jgi:hypothetical protein
MFVLYSKGVTIPSQRRYIEYFADYTLNKRNYEKLDLFLKSIVINLNEIKKDSCKSIHF